MAAGLLALLFSVAARAEITPDPPRTEGIHAIVVVDVATGPAGAEVNESSMLELLQSMRKMGIQVNVTKLAAGQIAPGNIVATIRRIDPATLKNRTLLFYFAGHGGTDPRTGHFLRTPSGDLSRSTLLAEIRAKSPALAVVLTDCCSTRATLNGVVPRVPPPPERRAIENLFLQHRGVVDINSSSSRPELGVYQAAFYHPAMGGLFTYAFTSMFEPVEPFLLKGPDDEIERQVPGSKEWFDHRRRFDSRLLWLSDRDKDGFLDWSEAVDHLGGVLMKLYEGYKEEVEKGMLTIRANPRDVQMILSQVSQDPQVFGHLAVRSDRPAPGEAAGGARVKGPRIGAVLVNRFERGGAFVEVTRVEPNSPATRILLWQNNRKVKEPFTLVPGDTITRANNVRVRSREDLARVLDAIPLNGEVNLTGRDAKTGKSYEATVVLDRYEEQAPGAGTLRSAMP